MAFDAGTIEGRIDINSRPASTALDEIARRAEEFEKRKFTPTLSADTAEADAKILSIQDRLDRISRDHVTAKVDVDGVARSETETELLNRQLSRLDGRRATAHVKVDRSGSGLGMLATTAITLGPAVLPALGAAGGLAGGLAAGFAAAGLSAVAFAAVAKPAVDKVTKAVQDLEKLQKQYDAATTNKQRATVLQKEAELWSSLTGPEQQAVKAFQAFDETWQHFTQHFEPGLMRIFAQGLDLARVGLTTFAPVVGATVNEVDFLMSNLRIAVQTGGGLSHFAGWLTTEGPRAIGTFLTTLGHFGEGFVNLLVAFTPLEHRLEDGMLTLSQRFADWSKNLDTNSGFQTFLHYLEREGPLVASTIASLAHAVTGLAIGLAPIGHIELEALQPVLQFVGDLGHSHPEVLTALAGGIIAVVGAMKVLNAVGSVSGGISGFRTSMRGLSEEGSGLKSGLGSLGLFLSGPWGVALGIGGVALGALVGHFISAKEKAEAFKREIQTLASQLQDAFAPDKFRPGANSAQVILNNLKEWASDIHNPMHDALQQFAEAGVTVNQLNQAIAGNTTYLGEVSNALQNSTTPTDAAKQALKALIGAYGDASNNSVALEAVTHSLGHGMSLVSVPLLDASGKVEGYRLQLLSAAQASPPAGTAMSHGVAAGINSGVPAISAASARAGTAARSGLGALYGEGVSAGNDLGIGLVVGIQQAMGATTTQAKIAADQVVKAIRYEAQTSSPSRRTAEIGRSLADGLTVGMLERTAHAVKAARTMTQATLDAVDLTALRSPGGSDYAMSRLGVSRQTANVRLTGEDMLHLARLIADHMRLGGPLPVSGEVTARPHPLSLPLLAHTPLTTG